MPTSQACATSNAGLDFARGAAPARRQARARRGPDRSSRPAQRRVSELARYYELGVDGLFADNDDTAVAVGETVFGRAPVGPLTSAAKR
jgi:hypothetical protein